MSFDERRSQYRASLAAPVTLQFESSSQPVTGFTGDVSEGGMFVRTESPKPVGTLVRFELDFGGPGGLVRSVGEVAWIRVRWEGDEHPAGMGIRFRYLDPEALEAVRSRVAAYLAENPPAPEPEPPPSPPAPERTSPPEPSPPPKRKAPTAKPKPERPKARQRPQRKPSASEKKPDDEGIPTSRWILLGILGLLLLIWLLF